jgi:hypothetical protein
MSKIGCVRNRTYPPTQRDVRGEYVTYAFHVKRGCMGTTARIHWIRALIGGFLAEACLIAVVIPVFKPEFPLCTSRPADNIPLDRRKRNRMLCRTLIAPANSLAWRPQASQGPKLTLC